jgi:hypothetical protein
MYGMFQSDSSDLGQDPERNDWFAERGFVKPSADSVGTSGVAKCSWHFAEVGKSTGKPFLWGQTKPCKMFKPCKTMVNPCKAIAKAKQIYGFL